MTRCFDVLLAGYYGFGNLGDELLAESAAGILRKIGIERGRIAILSATPAETSKQLDISAFDRWKPGEVIKAIRSSRSLLLGGGGLFQDTTSVRSCFYYWGLISAARVYGAVPWTVGQSIGPLRTAMAEKLAKNAMSACAFRGVRDEKSLELLRSWGLEGSLSPDLVMGLDIGKTSGTGAALLLNLRPGYEDLAEKAARAAQKTADELHFKIKCVAFSEEDEMTIKRFADKKIIKTEEITLAKTAADFEKASEGCSCALGMRLHFVILSFLSGLRVCAVPYDPKVKSLALRYNIPIVNENRGEITFSEPRGDGMAGCDAEKLSRVFSDGVASILGIVDG